MLSDDIADDGLTTAVVGLMTAWRYNRGWFDDAVNDSMPI